MTGRPPEPADERPPVAERIAAELTDRDASAFVHVGPAREPAVRYLLRTVQELESPLAEASRPDGRIHAVAHDGTTWYHRVAESDETSPAAALATDLSDVGSGGTVLTPARVPHDAALHLDGAGFSLASSDVLVRSRAEKSPDERARIEAAGTAAAAGATAAAAVLDAATVDDGRLSFEGGPLTAEQLRIAADRAVVERGAMPAGNTSVVAGETGFDEVTAPLEAGEPIGLALAPRGPAGYHGGLVRTLVVASEGGDERRAHVSLTRAFRSAEALLSADRPVSVADVERDLEAEIRAFGFEEGVRTDVAGVGLAPRERPLRGAATIGPDAVVRIEAAVAAGSGEVRLADCFAPGRGWLAAPSRSIDPAAVLE